MKRCTTFLEHLAARHFSTVKTAADLNLDAFGTAAHCSCDCHLHCTTVGDFAFDLASDVGCYDLSIEFGTLYLEDVDLNILVGDLHELFLQLVDILSALTDDESGT